MPTSPAHTHTRDAQLPVRAVPSVRTTETAWHCARAAQALSHVPLEVLNPVGGAAQLSSEFSLTATPPPDERVMPSFTPLAPPTEFPVAKGTIVAIDAEFVAVTHEESRTDHRGRTVVVKPARLALARVSCVRGEGPMAGVPFIDSYIQQAEPVVDYLTRFSGLQPGDLDPSVSRHHIETMKVGSPCTLTLHPHPPPSPQP